MLTLDRITVRAPLARAFDVARDVERWPAILPHYRWVRVLERAPEGGGGASVVEMAAWRPFGPFRWPTWWVSRMTIDRHASEIRYRHLRGITRDMEVLWRFGSTAAGAGVEIVVEHRWGGPRWPLVGGPVARMVIGPVFIHGIASRTLAGIKRHLEEA